MARRGATLGAVPKREQSPWRVLGVSLAVVLVLVSIALIVGTVGSPERDTLPYEFRKYVIQFLLITALGAVVAFVIDRMRRREERHEDDRRKQREAVDRRRQYETDTVRSLLDRLYATYRRVKRSRRLLRLIPLSHLSKQDYTDAMLKLNDDQEDIEQLWREIEALEPTLPELRTVRPSVEGMETYLKHLWDECEAVAANPDDEFQAVRLETLRRFVAKLGGEEKSNFPVFHEHYYDARKKLIILLANKQTSARPDTATTTRSWVSQVWRRGRDSNPRGAQHPNRFSKPAP
jgi:hypothetical protein